MQEAIWRYLISLSLFFFFLLHLEFTYGTSMHVLKQKLDIELQFHASHYYNMKTPNLVSTVLLVLIVDSQHIFSESTVLEKINFLWCNIISDDQK